MERNLKLSPLKALKKNTEVTADGRCTLQRMASKRYKMPRQPFSKLCSNLCAYCSNKLPEQGPTIAWLRVLSIMPLRAWAYRRFAYAQLSSLYLFYTLHVTRDKYTRPYSAFLYCKRQKVGRGLETRLMISCIDYFLSALLLSH